jgi:hypothetical protein
MKPVRLPQAAVRQHVYWHWHNGAGHSQRLAPLFLRPLAGIPMRGERGLLFLIRKEVPLTALPKNATFDYPEAAQTGSVLVLHPFEPTKGLE